MTPAQLAAYTAVCEADPECRCPLVEHRGGRLWHDTGDDEPCSPSLAAAAITDHLNTRLDGLHTAPSVNVRAGGLWQVWEYDSYSDSKELAEPLPKLSAYLAAHVIRLGLPRTLIENMENTNA